MNILFIKFPTIYRFANGEFYIWVGGNNFISGKIKVFFLDDDISQKADEGER